MNSSAEFASASGPIWLTARRYSKNSRRSCFRQEVYQSPAPRVTERVELAGPDRGFDLQGLRRVSLLFDMGVEGEHPQVVRETDTFPANTATDLGRREVLGQPLADPHRPLREPLLDANIVQDLVHSFMGDRRNRLLDRKLRQHVAQMGLLVHQDAIADPVVVGDDSLGHRSVTLKLPLRLEHHDYERHLGIVNGNLLAFDVCEQGGVHRFQDPARALVERFAGVVDIHVAFRAASLEARESQLQVVDHLLLRRRFERSVRERGKILLDRSQSPVGKQYDQRVADLDMHFSDQDFVIFVILNEHAAIAAGDRLGIGRQPDAEILGPGLGKRILGGERGRDQYDGRGPSGKGRHGHHSEAETAYGRRHHVLIPNHRMSFSKGKYIGVASKKPVSFPMRIGSTLIASG